MSDAKKNPPIEIVGKDGPAQSERIWLKNFLDKPSQDIGEE